MAAKGGLAFMGEAPNITGRDPVMRFPRPLGEAAATAIALCGDAAAEIWRRRTGQSQSVRVDVRAAAASLAGYAYLRLTPGEGARAEDWEAEPGGWRAWGARSVLRGENASNPAVGIYRCADGRWIHLHGGLPHLAERLLEVLDTDPAGIATAVGRWHSDDLEETLAEAETCGAIVRTAAEWRDHPVAQSLRDRPVVELHRIGEALPVPLPAGGAPLSGLKVLDLSSALAGPTCARTLAEHGAEVLHVAAAGRRDRQPFLADTGHGKRSTALDLKTDRGREKLVELLRDADVICQSYRTGALDRLGFGANQVAALRPGIIYLSINCYGHDTAWSGRRGWEGLAQAATGVTVPGTDGRPPRLAPCSCCDYLTGYLAARGVMEALLRRSREGGSWHVRASLCQTGMWLTRLGTVPEHMAPAEPDLFEDLLVESRTPFGRLRHLPPVTDMDITPPRRRRPPPLPGADPPAWTE
ncbi:CoA transferase [Tropicimonas sp. IMCC6043]|uniref:CoA transferase n=1 Tax=Tropicimonas sp. IMCC6043 TaxID=2510645 RepID=UPI00210F96F4|nr:CoA transferase [Tropicimonas sp. IMCC6043]